MLRRPLEELALDGAMTFSVEDVEEGGEREVRDLVPDGRALTVSDDNKAEYAHRVAIHRLTGSIGPQIEAFQAGLLELVPREALAILDPHDLDLLICGASPVTLSCLCCRRLLSHYDCVCRLT